MLFFLITLQIDALPEKPSMGGIAQSQEQGLQGRACVKGEETVPADHATDSKHAAMSALSGPLC